MRVKISTLVRLAAPFVRPLLRRKLKRYALTLGIPLLGCLALGLLLVIRRRA